MKCMKRMKHMKHLRKILIFLLAFIIIAASFPMLAFAEDEIDKAAATVMKMRKIEGTVRGTDKNGKALYVFKDMKLYDGYNIETLKNGYAWIELDSEKLLKLDAESRTAVQKSGKELDIILKKGRLYFNVATPLAEDEKMIIRTSTMAVGIRGTCGWVEIAGKNETRVFILEGTVQVAVVDPVTGEVKVGAISGGDSASGVVYDPKKPGDKCDIIRRRFTEKDVPGFVAVDVVNDMKHVGEIFEKSKTDVDLRRMTQAKAMEQLRAEQKAADKESQENNAVYTSESSAPSTFETPPSSETPASLTIAEIQERLNRGESVTILDAFTVDDDLTIPDNGAILTFNSPAEVANGANVTVNGTMNAENGLTNKGEITVNSSNSLNVKGVLNTQSGTLAVSKTGKVKADKLTGSVNLELGAQVLAGDRSGAVPNLTVNGGFTLEDGRQEWTADKDGYKRYAYIAYKFDNGTLTLAGSGPMKDYVQYLDENDNWVDTVPWNNNRENIRTIVIEGGVTSIGYDAFNGCSGLTRVDISSSVMSIGDMAFANCKGLTSVTIPNSVTSIGNAAFANCRGLMSVTIPDSVASIGIEAFAYCSGLTSVTIPSSVTSIGNVAFVYCSGLNAITVDKGNAAYCDVDGVLFTKNQDTLVSYPTAKNGAYVIPSSVTSIGGGAFRGCNGLTSVTIPPSVTNMDGSTFEGCSALTSINVLGENANCLSEDGVMFSHDRKTLLRYPRGKRGDYSIPSSVTSIGIGAFNGCNGLTSVEIPSSVTSIGDHVFDGCGSLTSVEIPSSVTSIGDYVFNGCSSLTSVEIPSSVTSIGNWAFSGCSGLTSITIPSSVTSIGDCAFSGCSGLESVTIPNSVTSIGAEVFSGCSGLTRVTISNSVTSIGNWVFSSCSGLTSITIPSSVTSIGSYAFADCSGLTRVEIPSSVTSIGSYAFADCSGLTRVEIPSSVTSIGDGAFIYCSGLTHIYFGGTEAQWTDLTQSGKTGIPDTGVTVYYESAGSDSAMFSEEPYSDETLSKIEEISEEPATFEETSESAESAESTESTELAEPEESSEESNNEPTTEETSESEASTETEAEETSGETDVSEASTETEAEETSVSEASTEIKAEETGGED